MSIWDSLDLLQPVWYVKEKASCGEGQGDKETCDQEEVGGNSGEMDPLKAIVSQSSLEKHLCCVRTPTHEGGSVECSLVPMFPAWSLAPCAVLGCFGEALESSASLEESVMRLSSEGEIASHPWVSPSSLLPVCPKVSSLTTRPIIGTLCSPGSTANRSQDCKMTSELLRQQ